MWGERPEVEVSAGQPLFWASGAVASSSRVISWHPGAEAAVPKAGAAAGAPGERGGLGSGWHAGGRPGVRLELARAAQPSPTPLRRLPPARSLRSVLRWTPWLRLGEGIEDSAPECVCLWTGPRVSRMCCPFENTALSSQVP